MSQQYDIFVSYAHVDNACMPGETQGWVTSLIETLEVHLQQKLGRRDSYSIWRDPELPGNVPLTPEILETVRHSSILLMILSPGYIASTWCMQELSTFLQTWPVEEGRVFVVERTLLQQPQRPAALSDLKGFPFWVPDKQQHGVFRTLGTLATASQNSEYFRQAEDLAIQLVGRINRLRSEAAASAAPAVQPANTPNGEASPKPGQSPIPPNGSANGSFKATVYLAPVSDTLEMERADMVRFLTQQQVRILPASNRLNLGSYQQDMEAALKDCTHFIQLLDGSSNMGIPVDQHMIADSSPVSILQWRTRGLDVAEVMARDPQHGKLLQGKNVMESDLVEFEQYVLQKLVPPPMERLSIDAQTDMIIFVNAGMEDLPLAQEVFDHLTDKGYFCLLPLTPSAGMTPSQIRMDLEQNLLECDAMLLVYAKSPAAQVRSHLLQGMRMRSRRPPDRPLRTAVCMAEDISQPLNAGGGMDLFQCASPLPGHCVKLFLDGGDA